MKPDTNVHALYTPFIRKVHSRQICRGRKQIGGCPELADLGEMGSDCWQVQGFFGGDKNVLKLDQGDGGTNVRIF